MAGTAPGSATGCPCAREEETGSAGGRRRRAEVPMLDEVMVDGQWVEPEEQGLGARQRAIRTDVTTLAERDQPSDTRDHVAARVPEGERRDREVSEEVDAVQTSGAHRVAIRALVQRAQRWRRTGDHVRDASPAAGTAEARLSASSCAFSRTVGEPTRVTGPSTLTSPRSAAWRASSSAVASESPAWRKVSTRPARVCLPAVGSLEVMPSSDPFQCACPATACPQPRSDGRIWWVHQDGEARGEDDRGAVHGHAIPPPPQSHDLIGEAACE